jgi:hypothetical protein
MRNFQLITGSTYLSLLFLFDVRCSFLFMVIIRTLKAGQGQKFTIEVVFLWANPIWPPQWTVIGKELLSRIVW